MTSSRERVSCDIRLPSNETPSFIWSIRSRRYIRGKTLQWWNAAATMPAVSRAYGASLARREGIAASASLP
jgi:hypothetical protein